MATTSVWTVLSGSSVVIKTKIGKIANGMGKMAAVSIITATPDTKSNWLKAGMEEVRIAVFAWNGNESSVVILPKANRLSYPYPLTISSPILHPPIPPIPISSLSSILPLEVKAIKATTSLTMLRLASSCWRRQMSYRSLSTNETVLTGKSSIVSTTPVRKNRPFG